nr:hypothetical protein CFP56_33584 [Quercus suber]
MPLTLLEQIDERRSRNLRNYHQNRRPRHGTSAHRSLGYSNVDLARTPRFANLDQGGQHPDDIFLSRHRNARGLAAEPPRADDQLQRTAQPELVDERWQGGRAMIDGAPTPDRRRSRYHHSGAGLRDRSGASPSSPCRDSALPSPAFQRSRPASVDLRIDPESCARQYQQVRRGVPVHSISAEQASRKYTVDAPLLSCRRSRDVGRVSLTTSDDRTQSKDPQVSSSANTSSFQVLNRRPLTLPRPHIPSLQTDDISLIPTPQPHHRWPLLDSPPQIEDEDFSFQSKHARSRSRSPTPPHHHHHRRRRCSCRTQASTTTASTWTKYSRDPIPQHSYTAPPAQCEHGNSPEPLRYHCSSSSSLRSISPYHAAPSLSDRSTASSHPSAAPFTTGTATATATAAAAQVPTASGAAVRISGHFRVAAVRTGTPYIVPCATSLKPTAGPPTRWSALEAHAAQLCRSEEQSGYPVAETVEGECAGGG